MNPDDLRRAYAAMKVTTHHRRMKQKAIEYKGGKCQVCGYNRSASGLTFHHRDPSQKDFSISGRTLGWEKMRPELDKCDLLCMNCHAEEHERLTDLGRQELYVAIRTEIPLRLPGEVVRTSCFTCGASIDKLKSGIRSERLFCSLACSAITQQRAKWPTREILERLVQQYPLTVIGKHLGVSANAVKKRTKKLGVSLPARGCWQKQRHSGLVQWQDSRF